MVEATARTDPPSSALPRTLPGVQVQPGMSREQLLRRLLSVIEVSTGDVTCCTHCGGTNLGRWGKSRRVLQRWRCRACERSCTAATGTALARVHSLDKLRTVALDMLAPMPASCRKLAARLGLDRMTVWRWRKLLAAAWAEVEATLDAATNCVAASDTVILRESRKASREWVRHRQDPARYPAPDRLRWIDYRALDLPLPEPMARYRVDVRLSMPIGKKADERATSQVPSTETARQEQERCSKSSAHANLRTNPDLHNCTTDRASAPRSAGSRQGRLPAERAIPPVELFRQFIKPFRGPSTQHLETYRTWFLARLLDPVRR